MQEISLETSLSHLVVRAFREVNRLHSRALSEHGISAEQVHVLTVLWHHGAMTTGDLQRAVALSSGTIAGVLSRMEKAGRVTRSSDPGDGRRVLVQAAVGGDERSRIEATLQRAERAIFGHLDQRTKGALRETLLQVEDTARSAAEL